VIFRQSPSKQGVPIAEKPVRLKKASRAWNLKFDDIILQSSLIRSNANPCVYFQTYQKEKV
jgi:hypothetical protein